MVWATKGFERQRFQNLSRTVDSFVHNTISCIYKAAPFLTGHSALQLLTTFTVTKYTSATDALSQADITCSSHTHARTHARTNHTPPPTHTHTHNRYHWGGGGGGVFSPAIKEEADRENLISFNVLEDSCWRTLPERESKTLRKSKKTFLDVPMNCITAKNNGKFLRSFPFTFLDFFPFT